MDRIVRTAAIAFCVGLAGCANTRGTFDPSVPHVKIDLFIPIARESATSC